MSTVTEDQWFDLCLEAPRDIEIIHKALESLGAPILIDRINNTSHPSVIYNLFLLNANRLVINKTYLFF